MLRLPSFSDTNYKATDRVYLTDRLLNRSVLWAIPLWVTPNHITLLRMVVIVPTIILLAYHNYEWGVPFFIFAALTDAVDGALARTRNMITTWGMLFDPFADKLLIVPALLILLFTHVSKILVGAIVGVEVLTIVCALLWRNQGRVVQASVWGKLKMILEVIGVLCILLTAWLHLPLLGIAWIILYASVGCAVMGIVRYSV